MTDDARATPFPESARWWREDLDSWAIPPEILAAAPETPWGCPPKLFARAAEEALAARAAAPTASLRRALEALPEGGSVLDVGAGGGAASLPLCPPAAAVTAVDQSPQMLAAFAGLAGRLGIDHTEVDGLWPDVAGKVGPTDVVVCHHVLYNVADLAPFVTALTGHARRRVVAELTAEHPLAGLRPLWRRFHDLDRPAGPTAGDAAAALAALGLEVARQDWESPDRFGFDDFDELVAFARRRLCLPAGRDPEVAEALLATGTRRVGSVWVTGGPRRVTTLSWPGAAG
jgi:SAM-dependent methyltransferase